MNCKLARREQLATQSALGRQVHIGVANAGKVYQLTRNRHRADFPPSSAPISESATACKPYGESRKARNRNTNPPSGVGVKKRPIPRIATMTEAIVRKKAQRSKRNQHRAVSRARTRAKGAAITFNIIFIVETSFLSFYLHFTMPAREHKCCE